MSVIRIKHNTNYVILHKQALEDVNLSLKAKGLWAFCMSKPDDWRFHVSQMVTVLKEGKAAIYSALKELIAFGYCEKKQVHDGKFLSGVEYVVYETPEFKKSLQLSDFQHAENQLAENQQLPRIHKQPRIKEEHQPPPQKKDKEWWRGFFSDWSKEEFEYVWQEFSEAKPGQVKSQKAWMMAVKERCQEVASKQAQINEVVTARREICLWFDEYRKQWRGDFVRDKTDCVEFTCGPRILVVRYDVTEEEWVTKTGDIQIQSVAI